MKSSLSNKYAPCNLSVTCKFFQKEAVQRVCLTTKSHMMSHTHTLEPNFYILNKYFQPPKTKTNDLDIRNNGLSRLS